MCAMHMFLSSSRAKRSGIWNGIRSNLSFHQQYSKEVTIQYRTMRLPKISKSLDWNFSNSWSLSNSPTYHSVSILMTSFRYSGRQGDTLLVAHMLIKGNTNFW
jgi:hypothetical protein